MDVNTVKKQARKVIMGLRGALLFAKHRVLELNLQNKVYAPTKEFLEDMKYENKTHQNDLMIEENREILDTAIKKTVKKWQRRQTNITKHIINVARRERRMSQLRAETSSESFIEISEWSGDTREHIPRKRDSRNTSSKSKSLNDENVLIG